MIKDGQLVFVLAEVCLTLLRRLEVDLLQFGAVKPIVPKRACGRSLRVFQIVVMYSDRECAKWLKGQCILNLEHLARTIAEAVATSGHTVKLNGASLNKQTSFKISDHDAFVWKFLSMRYL